MHRALLLTDETATRSFGAALAGLARAGDVITLTGPLGAGKSVLARAFVRALTAPDEEVPSPTFTLVQTYEPADPDAPLLWHFDLYRLEDPEEAVALDIEDAFADGISLIEWPDRLGPWLPASRLDVTLAPLPEGGEEARQVQVTASGSWAERLPADLCVFLSPSEDPDI